MIQFRLSCLRILLFVCFAGTLTTVAAQTYVANYTPLMEAYGKAMGGTNNWAERRAAATELSKVGHLQYYGDLENFKYVYALLRESNHAADVQQSVAAMDTFLRNSKDRYGYHFTGRNYREEWAMSLLLISKYYYFVQAGAIKIDPRYTVAEAARWLEDAFTVGGHINLPEDELKAFKEQIISLQESFQGFGDPKATAETREVLDRYAALFICRLGDYFIKKNNKREAKSCYKLAIRWGNDDARKLLADINVPAQSPYGVFDYRRVSHTGTIAQSDLQSFGGGTQQAASYDEWWRKTYGPGGSQTGTASANTGATGGTSATAAEEARHQRAMEQIYRDTEKQLQRSFDSHSQHSR